MKIEGILKLSNLKKQFSTGDSTVSVLSGLNLEVQKGDSVSIIGTSGSGKSTLLSLIAGLETPTEGSISLAGKNLSEFSEKQLTQFRAQHLAIVFQRYHLLPHLTALENVMLPLEIAGHKEPKEKATDTLGKFGLKNRQNHWPHQLSGGEQQRVAIARAFIVEPDLILADEPSGSLDPATGSQVIDLIYEQAEALQQTLLVVTHNMDIAKRSKKTFELKHGQLHEQT